MSEERSISLLGAGWLGLPLAKQLKQRGYTVKAATTSVEKAEQLRQSGFQSYQLVVEPTQITGDYVDFFKTDTLVLTLPPGGRRNPHVSKTYPEKIRQVIAEAQLAGVQQILFTSSTGVYGNQIGWVNEDSALSPITTSGEALVEVEELLQQTYGNRLTILRLAGLVGGNRHPGRWFAGKKDIAGGEKFVNLVEQTDVVALCMAIIESGYWGHILNVCADEHPTKAAYYPTASAALDLAIPTFKVDTASDPGKRVENGRSKLVPGFAYQYPDPLDFF